MWRGAAPAILMDVSLAETEVGPFRDASPTPEARLESERRASLERVAEACTAALARDARREARLDGAATLAVIGTLLATGATLALSVLDPGGPWLAFLCLAGSTLITAALALFHRSRVRHRRATRRLRAG